MKNSTYWKKRAEEISEIQFKKADKLSLKIYKEYQKADRYIQQKIESYYIKYASKYDINYADSKKLLTVRELKDYKMTLEEFKDKALNNEDDKWTKQLDAEYMKRRISRLEALKNDINNKVNELSGIQTKELKEHLNSTYKNVFNKNINEFVKEFGMANEATINEEIIEKAIYSRWINEKNFADRIQDNKKDLMKNLNTIITQGLITGSSSDEMVNKLIKATRISRNRAINLIQTETTFIIGKANTDMYEKFGVEEYEVIETLDSSTCGTCSLMDGKRFKVSEKQEGLNSPPFHTRCRGTTVPVSKYEKIWGKDDRIAKDGDGNIYYTDNDPQEYVIQSYDNYKAINERKSIKDAIKTIPYNHKNLIKNTKFNIIKIGNSCYDRKNDIIYVLKNSKKSEVIHEIGHAIETKLDLYNDENFIKILEDKIDTTDLYAIKIDNTFVQTIEIIENRKFISKYQGRVYTTDMYNNDRIDYTNGKLNVKVLGEYFSEGYREYFENPKNLKHKDYKLYKFIRELLK